ncbi:hypothetical protein Rumeso_03879 [Rubellimicrobium mesophilum DSM 19309]|uniref:Argininosuccinate lyase n=1 Tax=Rubellimicrobium mesophilum DSM 19309 TaxID=442562 RepID=A0A017HKC4_9RHOB|nr:hypothetical protein [Rubellimicrobium mesophilum]EYD74583.1 hypothetical protein Rumeso_03879 [Rubellimicrobium mesophilum DSM 19309]
MRIAALLGLLALAACGADGPPMRPGASVGVGVSDSGVAFGGGFEASNGTVSVGVGL